MKPIAGKDVGPEFSLELLVDPNGPKVRALVCIDFCPASVLNPLLSVFVKLEFPHTDWFADILLLTGFDRKYDLTVHSLAYKAHTRYLYNGAPPSLEQVN